MRIKKALLGLTSLSLIAVCLYGFWLPTHFESIGRSSMPLEERLEKYDQVIADLENTSNTLNREKLVEAIERSKTYESANDHLDKSYKKLVTNLAWLLASILLVHFVLIYEIAFRKNPD